ncbi:hypothetical protein BDV32DRAFT_140774 [Aspergillus pseudonomiae]|uniref:Uncharacterized protein n=1 Tax=Aspergillus pseudonomiae TaxID=1506151 RepID=A0A5N6HTJ3_9EURO|nr:uncharacterized protein BDV37DRAFT_274229 [Aspergillus pseudonomiae]KAB8257007.1 hypothetical protein BDV32DRAFT_140774 [Aspergillus pseudonomiae]KAE8400738.1 hypothetical protein BDV37DRAFT_274229 [Aspergillus pseudonomiae]
MRFDDVAWAQSETISDALVEELLEEDTLRAIGNFIVKHRKGVPLELCQPRAGAFNVSFRMKFEDGGSALIRFPKPEATMFPEEKMKREVTMIRYIQEYTSIPYHSSYIGEQRMIIVLFSIHLSTSKSWKCSTDSWQTFYSSCHSYHCHGSALLAQIDDFTWEVRDRPLSIGMNEPALDSAEDCRRILVARQLFSKLAREGRLTHSTNDHGPFKIWCDDLRPSNVLEFTYAAPVEFSHAPPWWLLLEQPEYWPDGIEAWTKAFETRLQTFLKVQTEREETAMQRGRLRLEQRLSGPMRQSWVNGDCWSEEERQYIEQVVSQKLEQIKTRALAWGPEEVDTAEARHSVV